LFKFPEGDHPSSITLLDQIRSKCHRDCWPCSPAPKPSWLAGALHASHGDELAQGSGMATASRLAQGAPLSGLSALRRGLADTRSFGAGRNPASRTFV